MPSARLPIHGRDHRPGGIDPIPFAAVAAGSWPWAVAAINGFYSVPTATDTAFGIDDGALTTSTDDSSIFETEESAAPGVFGVKINAPGIYAFFWTVEYDDVFGHRVSTPENYRVFAQDASGSTGTFVIAPTFFSNFAVGFANGSRAQWDVGWMSIWATDGTTASNPFVLSGKQSTGETLHAYTSLWVVQFSASTHDWT